MVRDGYRTLRSDGLDGDAGVLTYNLKTLTPACSLFACSSSDCAAAACSTSLLPASIWFRAATGHLIDQMRSELMEAGTPDMRQSAERFVRCREPIDASCILGQRCPSFLELTVSNAF